MIPDAYREIVEELHRKTMQGAVQWTTTVNQQEFLVYFAKSTLSIRLGYDDDDRERFVLFTLKNEQGKNIDFFSVPESDEWFQKAEELHIAARRKAHRVDEALRSIADELRASDDVVGRKPHADDDEVPF
jgi:hypothetical protein